MTHTTRAFCATAGVLVALLLAASAAAQSSAHPAVRGFEAYQRAVTGRDGRSAADLVTRDSIALYERCRRAALTMERDALRRQDFMVKLTTLSLRLEFEAATLERLDGRGVLVHLVDQGRVGTQSGSFVVGDVHPGPTRTVIEARNEDGDHVGRVVMRRERGAWRVDLLAMVQEMSAQLAQASSRLGRPELEDGAIMMALALMYRDRARDVDPWAPLARR